MALFTAKNVRSLVSMGPSFFQSIIRNVPLYVNYDLTLISSGIKK